MGPYWTKRNHMGPSKSILNHTVPLRTKWDLKGPYCTRHGKSVWQPSGASGKIQKKGLNLEFHLGGNLKMQICWRKSFPFFHVCIVPKGTKQYHVGPYGTIHDKKVSCFSKWLFVCFFLCEFFMLGWVHDCAKRWFQPMVLNSWSGVDEILDSLITKKNLDICYHFYY